MEVLFEYRGSRRTLTASTGEKAVDCVTAELQRIGRSRAQVYTANVNLSTVDRNREVYLLQKWSPQWDCYLDVHEASEINDGDKLAVVIKPNPPSKLLMLCCWCTGVQNEPQVQGVPRSKMSAVRKNEEIQSLDLLFNIESVRHSCASDFEETQSQAHSEVRDGDLNDGEQYVRSESGRASWKLVPMKVSDSSDVLTAAENDTQDAETVKPDSPALLEQPESESVENLDQVIASAEQKSTEGGHEEEGKNARDIEKDEKPSIDDEERADENDGAGIGAESSGTENVKEVDREDERNEDVASGDQELADDADMHGQM